MYLIHYLPLKYKAKDRIITPLKFASKYIFKGLHIVMLFAPIGAFGGMAFTIGKYGIATLLPLGKPMLTVYITMAIFVFIVLGGILKIYNFKIICIRPSNNTNNTAHINLIRSYILREC
jgi:aerobic C4-dicarboxylate transport protein